MPNNPASALFCNRLNPQAVRSIRNSDSIKVAESGNTVTFRHPVKRGYTPTLPKRCPFFLFTLFNKVLYYTQ